MSKTPFKHLCAILDGIDEVGGFKNTERYMDTT